MRMERLGDLNVRLCGGDDGEGGGRGPAVVLMHGFGAGGDDLVGLSRVLDVPEGTRFVFPEAPLALDPFGSRAWWMIDPEIFERRARGEAVDRTGELPEALPTVRAMVEGLLDALPERLGVSDDDVILGGFSQGAMLALDVTLHRERKPRALALLSGTLIARSEWEPRMEGCRGLPVFQSHGQLDPVLPFEVAEELRQLLSDAGAPPRFVPFRGAHEIPMPVLSELGSFLREALSAI